MKDIFYGVTLIVIAYGFIFVVGMLGKIVWGL